MLQYIARRFLIAIPMLLGAMSIVFFAMRVLPGDPCVAMMGDQATTEALAGCTKNLGLNRPLAVQYVDYLWRSLRFDFGNSFRQGYPVSDYIARMFPHTFILVMASAVVAALVGIPLGIVSALKRRNPLVDYPLRILALLGLSMPVFWLGILLLIVFSLRLDLFPLIGGGDLDGVLAMLGSGEVFSQPWDFLAGVADVLHHLTLPALALGFTLAATVSRLSRSAMLEVISQDYIRTARAKGQRERLVVYKHALRNMMVPLLMIVVAAAAPLVAPRSPSPQFSDSVLKGPGVIERHLLGTDEFGRDILSRIIWGARVSLQVGLASVVFAFVLGVPLGIVAGVGGGRVETLIMRCADMLMAFPTLLLALIIVTALGGSLGNEILAIGVALTPNFLRLARSLALTIREQDYILAARALGSGQLRLMARHVFPNTVYALVVVASLYIATAIRTEAGLSFLGLGIPPPTPSWGNILSEGRQYIKCCPWITTFSGLAIMLAVLAFNLMGDALRDLLDPRLKGE